MARTALAQTALAQLATSRWLEQVSDEEEEVVFKGTPALSEEGLSPSGPDAAALPSASFWQVVPGVDADGRESWADATDADGNFHI